MSATEFALSQPVHFTTLRLMGQSPAHYLARLMYPREPSPAMRIGTLVHAITFSQPVTVYEGDRRGKAWTEFRDAHAGEFIATGSEMQRAGAVVAALRAHPLAAPLLKGRNELELDWTFAGRRCSSRLDVLGDRDPFLGDGEEPCGFVTELKTASSVQPDRFRAACLGRLAYHGQLGFYEEAARSLEGGPPRRCYIVGVETEPPYAVTVMRLTPRAIGEGVKLCRLWMEMLLGCEASGEWPAYAQSILPLDIEQDAELIFDDPDSAEEAA